MAFELVYTSAPSGIKTGTTGFCVVAYTNGMGIRLMTVLESLSAYKPVYPHYHENAWDNPVSCAHYVSNINGSLFHILSRICFNGMDHTQRSNKLASYLALSQPETEVVQSGPGALFFEPDMFKDASWEIKPELYSCAKTIPPLTAEGGICSLWESLTGDAGWGGVLADRFIQNPKQPVYIIFDPLQHRNMIGLLNESLLLLPPDMRWQVSFNSYFVTLPAGMTCSWRCCTPDAECLTTARRSPDTLIIDLTKPMNATPDGDYVQFARTGICPQSEQPEEQPQVQEQSVTQIQEQEQVSRPVNTVSPVFPQQGLGQNNVRPVQGLRVSVQNRNHTPGYTPQFQQPSPYANRTFTKAEKKKSYSTIIVLAAACGLLLAVGIILAVTFLKENQDSSRSRRQDFHEDTDSRDDSQKTVENREKKQKTEERQKTEQNAAEKNTATAVNNTPPKANSPKTAPAPQVSTPDKNNNALEEDPKLAWIKGEQLYGKSKKAEFRLGDTAKMSDIIFKKAKDGSVYDMTIVDVNTMQKKTYITAEIKDGKLILQRICDTKEIEKIYFEYNKLKYYLYFEKDYSVIKKPKKIEFTCTYSSIEKGKTWEPFTELKTKWKGGKEFENMKLSKGLEIRLDISSDYKNDPKIIECLEKLKKLDEVSTAFKKMTQKIHKSNNYKAWESDETTVEKYSNKEVEKYSNKEVEKNIKIIKDNGYGNIKLKDFVSKGKEKREELTKELQDAHKDWLKQQKYIIDGTEKTQFSLQDVEISIKYTDIEYTDKDTSKKGTKK